MPPSPVSVPKNVRFAVGTDHCAADLRIPHGEPPFAVVIMAGGLGGVRAIGLPPFAERFLAAGYAVMTFDYRSFGESTGSPRQVLSIAAQREDWAGAITFAQGHELLDSSRLVLWGTSFAGGHVLTVAAQRQDIAAVIAQGPFTDGIASANALSIRSRVRIAPYAVRDAIRGLWGGDPVTIESAGPPGSPSLMNAPDAAPGIERLMQAAGADMDTRVSARIALTLPFDRPGRKLGGITAPTLIQVCSPDSVAPDHATVRHVERARNPNVHLERINAGHFEIYHDQPFEQAVGGQIAFLAAHVPPRFPL